MGKTFGRYSPSRRFEEVRALLNSSGGVTVYEIAERLGISVRTAIRYLKALEESGERIYDERDGNKKIWRLMPSARQGTLSMTVQQMTTLFLSRRVFDFLEGTGFKEDLDEIFHQLEAHLKRKDFTAVKNLDRKLFDVNEAPFIYDGRIEDVDDIISALVYEQQLEVVHSSVARGQKKFTVDPYTLLVYKKGLYLAGWSHQHREMRTFGLDGFKEVTWLKGKGFEYPKDYDPESLVEGSFGLIKGPVQKVRIFFDDKVARFVKRRKWHPTQEIEKVPGGIVMSLEVKGTVELKSWVLGFGDRAEILAPEALRVELARELEAASSRYRAPAGAPVDPTALAGASLVTDAPSNSPTADLSSGIGSPRGAEPGR
ncbi:transcriptional regulator [Myxococcota bacterium]|nr:transcriptional regulator [Myxococcota bacterium]